MIALVAATASGRATARALARAWPDAELVAGRPREALAEAFGRADAIVAFLAVGAAVRLLQPLLRDKRSDPGVVCVDDAARFAVAVVGGHAGGANRVAARVAETLGAQAVVTTASDATQLPALDSLGAKLGFRVDPASDLAAVGAALVGGERVALRSERRWPLGPLPPNVEHVAPDDPQRGPEIVISDRVNEEQRHPVALYRPPTLHVGVGCSRGAGTGEICALVAATLGDAGLAAASVASFASIDLKADEPGLLEAARGHELRFFAAGELEAVDVPNPSDVVRAAVGTPSVAEAAALASAGRAAGLVAAKRKSEHATVAVARAATRGRLSIVSLGPGDDRLIPPLARDALAEADLVVGLERYVMSVRHLLRPGTEVQPYALGEEVERCRRAVGETSTGRGVALVSSGDVGVYAMAAPALEDGGLELVDVTVVPGVTAANAAAALLGAPLGHDHCSISLSDLLTPWEVIRRRIEAAAAADFVISFYNPRSRARDWQLDEARRLLLAERAADTPVALVTDAYRGAQRVELSTLAGFDCASVSMTTLVVVGSSQTRVVDGRMVTPRGYREAAVCS